LERLIRLYWKPIYFFVRRMGYDVERSKDFTQGFFTAFLERDFLQYVKKDRGKFRTFLLTTLKHFAADEHDREKALKRGGGQPLLSLNFAEAESEICTDLASDETPERLFQKKWALRLLANALQKLRAEEPDQFEVFRLHFTPSAQLPSHAELAQTLGISEGDVKVRLHAQLLGTRVLLVQEEIRDLFSAWSQ
jgi:RNA polymerase sigma-70 factor (ECF subfamily)